MTRPPFLLASALLCTLTLSNPPAQAGGLFIESFNTTTYKDAANTTANWDTGTGELKLHVLTPSVVGAYNTPGSAISVVIAGNLAFVADEGFGLRILNIANPASPVPVGSYDTPGAALHVAIDGDLAYVADEASGLQIISIANPASPTLVGTYDTPGFALGVAVSGNLAFVTDAFDGLHIIDVTNPASPVLNKTYNTAVIAARVAVVGNLVFVTDDTGGLVILDVTDPMSPLLVAIYNTPGNASGIAVSGDLAFVSDGTSGLQILNISNPATPTLVATYNTPGFANGIVVTGDVAYVADDATGLLVFDITNPSSPVLDATINTPGLALGVAVAGEHAYVADELSGLQVVKVTERALPRLVGAHPTQHSLGVAVDGDLAFVTNMTGLQIISIADPASPSFVGTYSTPVARDVVVAGDLAYVVDQSSGLHVVNIANPASPTFVGGYDTPGLAIRVALAGDLAFLADYESGLQIIGITDPASPTLVATYDTPGYAYDVAVSGDLAFVVTPDLQGTLGFQIIDITNPASPSLVSTYDTPGLASNIAVDGDLVYVADGGSLEIINVANPASPSLVGSYFLIADAQDVAVVGDLAFVVIDDSDPAPPYFGSLQIIDVADPANPTLVDTHGMQGEASRGIAVAGGLAFVTTGSLSGGLRLVEVFNHRFYTRSDIGQSLNVDATDDVIVAARLTSTQTPSVNWEISANAGTNWQSVPSDNSWTSIAVESNDLRWRSRHALTGWPGANPTVSDLQIEWLYEFATIDAITDIPDDQGGWVRLSATRSGRDLAAETLPISHYGIWRRVDTSPMAAALASAPRDVSTIDPSIVEAFGALPIFGYGRDVYVESAPGQLTGTLPPGTWALVTNIPALQQQTYLADVPTLADETVEGIEYTVFVVTAHTTTPSIWYASPTASGYSIDNIAPGVPTGFAIAYNTGSGNTLSWDPSQDDDFQYFRVYRSTDPDFTPSPGTLVHATATTGWSDPDYDGYAVYYKITALDYVGNESDPATAGSMTSIDETRVPARAALYQNHPNPFNPTTQIRYDVPVGGADVQLAIYDVSGRRVRVLVSGREAEGEKSIGWDARDDAGVSVATGIYFYRVTIGDFAATRKMVLLK